MSFGIAAVPLHGAPPQSPAQDRVSVTAAEPDRHPVRALAASIWADQKPIWTSPFHINRDNARWWLLVGAGTAGLLAADHPQSQALPRTGNVVDAGNQLSRIGQWYTILPVAGAFYLTGAARHNDTLRDTGFRAAESIADVNIVVNIMKVIARRERPRNGDHGGHFEKGGASFPSGHSAQAWALASVITAEYPHRPWVSVIAYSYATSVSAARVLAQQHFSSDVFVGGAIGFFLGRYVVYAGRERRAAAGRFHAFWSPYIAPDFGLRNRQVTLAWAF